MPLTLEIQIHNAFHYLTWDNPNTTGHHVTYSPTVNITVLPCHSVAVPKPTISSAYKPKTVTLNHRADLPKTSNVKSGLV